VERSELPASAKETGVAGSYTSSSEREEVPQQLWRGEITGLWVDGVYEVERGNEISQGILDALLDDS
jgi:hypothetical protein